MSVSHPTIAFSDWIGAHPDADTRMAGTAYGLLAYSSCCGRCRLTEPRKEDRIGQQVFVTS